MTKSLYALLLAISVLLLSETALAQESLSLQQQAVVYFIMPVPVKVALTEAALYGVHVVELRHSNHVLDQDIQGGYFPNPALSPEENAKRYKLVYTRSLKNLLNEAEEAYAQETDAQMKIAWQRHILVLDSALAQLNKDEGLRVVSMVVQSKLKAINELTIRSSKVERVETFLIIGITKLQVRASFCGRIRIHGFQSEVALS